MAFVAGMGLYPGHDRLRGGNAYYLDCVIDRFWPLSLLCTSRTSTGHLQPEELRRH
jgi:hypothetical protein